MKISDSRLKSFKKCPRKYYYSYELDVEPVRGAPPLRIGSAVHKYLELSAVNPTDEGRETAVVEAMSVYAECPKWADEYEWAIERSLVMALIEAYAMVYATDKLEHVCIEQRETVDVTGDIQLEMVWDNIFRRGSGRSTVMLLRDYKTTSNEIEDEAGDYWLRLLHDPQPAFYLWGARSIGHNVAGILYDVIRKPKLDPAFIKTDLDGRVLDADEAPWVIDDATGERAMTKSGTPRKVGGDGFTVHGRKETPEEYRERMLGVLLADPGKYFKRRMVPRTHNEVDRVMRESVMLARTITWYRDNGIWPKSECHDCPRCEFFSICSVDADDESVLSNVNYKKKEKRA